MITLILLFWIGLALNAPVWYWVLYGCAVFFDILSFGIKMYKIGADE